MTADEKIRESEYNFKKLTSIDKMSEAFVWEFNSFITSSRSILDHLINDFITKFKFIIPKDAKDLRTEFHKQAKNNTVAKKFISWFEGEYANLIKNSDYGFLIKTRHLIIHRETVRPNKYRIGINFPQGLTVSSNTVTDIPVTINHNSDTVKISSKDRTTGERKETEVQAEPIHEPYLSENPDKPIEEICRLFLDEIKKKVEYAHSNF